MTEEKGKKDIGSALEDAGRLGHKSVLESPLSVIKMDVSELRNFTNRLNDFLSSPGTAAIKICECCINVD